MQPSGRRDRNLPVGHASVQHGPTSLRSRGAEVPMCDQILELGKTINGIEVQIRTGCYLIAFEHRANRCPYAVIRSRSEITTPGHYHSKTKPVTAHASACVE
jgi:hypothetical protein